MAEPRTIVVAIEDHSMAGAAAAEAVRLAIANQATDLVLVHVVEEHSVINGMLAITGSYVEPMHETTDDCARLLNWAVEMVRAEFTARNYPAPKIHQELGGGHAGEAIARVAAAHQAGWMVLGARRPHLFGRLTHPDVRSHIATHSGCEVHIAPLQESHDVPNG